MLQNSELSNLSGQALEPNFAAHVAPDAVAELAARLRARGWLLATAESCTGGLIAAACTQLAGSSDWFDRGFVSYSNAAKSELLGVPAELIAAHGAVSEAVARAMAEGALARSHARLAVAVTGVAGPAGGSADKPVGTVWFAWAEAASPAQALAPAVAAATDAAAAHAAGVRVRAEVCRFDGDRAAVRAQTVQHALLGLLSWA